MLLRFRVANHRSIRDEQTLSLVTVPRRGEPKDLSTVRVAGIYGANASGKSNVLDALRWMISAIESSHTSWNPTGGVPRHPFKLSADGAATPSFFEIDFLHEGARYSYGFEVVDDQVVGEWLYTFPHGRRRKLFERTSPHNVHFGRGFTGQAKRILELTRPNSLYLSAGASNNHTLLSSLYTKITRFVLFAQHTEQDEEVRLGLTKYALTLPNIRKTLNRLLQVADLGVAGAELVERTSDPSMDKLIAVDPDYFQEPDRVATLKAVRSDVVLRRSVATVPLNLEEESAGTRIWLSMLGHTLFVLWTGGVLVADEIDSSLHPMLSSTLIRMFKDPVINRSGSQLIFASHDTTLLGSLLDQEILARDEVWFTEKDESGATSLYSLAEFHPRRDENVERGYLQGRYGGVPYVSFDQIRQIFTEQAITRS
ncbi:AAA family ATPase [Thermoactinospora rubra]|uniref:AAA family ATPase n=1 Tax=Thermoactinospora rubra TaxID=1088767 RepID=UPI000A11C695|nr:ATP-binding protein [Thermoactinospora rubra]